MTALNNTTGTFSVAGQELLGSWGGTVIYLALFVFIPLAMIGIGFAVLWNIASYTRFKKYFQWIFGTTPIYFITGLVSILTLSIPFAFLYWGYSQAKKGNVVPIKYTFFIIIGYVVISFIGWLVQKYVLERVQDFEKQLKKKPKVLNKLKGGMQK